MSDRKAERRDVPPPGSTGTGATPRPQTPAHPAAARAADQNEMLAYSYLCLPL